MHLNIIKNIEDFKLQDNLLKDQKEYDHYKYVLSRVGGADYDKWEYIAPLKSTFPEYFADNISSTPINSPRQGDLDEPHTMPPPSTTAIPLGPPPPRSTTALQHLPERFRTIHEHKILWS